MREWLDLPLREILFDVEHNTWLPAWGTPPATLQARMQVCRQLVADAPTLIPVCQHRFMPDEPHLSGNPIFSVHQTDIIHYGTDLRDYLLREIDPLAWEDMPEHFRPIRFWDVDEFQKRWTAEGHAEWSTDAEPE